MEPSSGGGGGGGAPTSSPPPGSRPNWDCAGSMGAPPGPWAQGREGGSARVTPRPSLAARCSAATHRAARGQGAAHQVPRRSVSAPAPPLLQLQARHASHKALDSQRDIPDRRRNAGRSRPPSCPRAAGAAPAPLRPSASLQSPRIVTPHIQHMCPVGPGGAAQHRRNSNWRKRRAGQHAKVVGQSGHAVKSRGANEQASSVQKVWCGAVKESLKRRSVHQPAIAGAVPVWTWDMQKAAWTHGPAQNRINPTCECSTSCDIKMGTREWHALQHLRSYGERGGGAAPATCRRLS